MNVQPDLATQIQNLRKDIFWTRCILGVAVICVAALSVANWKRHPRTVEANEFVVRGRTGNVAARLGQDSFGDTCLTLTAKEDVAVANMCVQDDEGSSLDLHNLKSESRATITPGFYAHEPFMRFRPALVINGVNYATGAK